MFYATPWTTAGITNLLTVMQVSSKDIFFLWSQPAALRKNLSKY